MRGRQHSPKFISDVLTDKRAGEPVRDIAKKHGIHQSLVYRWARDAAAARSVAAKKGHRARTRRTADVGSSDARTADVGSSDVEKMVSGLLDNLRPTLVEVIGKLVELGVERKVGEAMETLVAAFKVAT